ncbi:MAG: efflux RND transporter permease subunit, partial [Myxococcota bacterium]
MNGGLVALLGRSRLVGVLVVLSALVGLLAWSTMPRQEDPSFPKRLATLAVPWPGADPIRVERLVMRPLEDALADVPEIDSVVGTARTGLAVFGIQLKESIYDTDAAWNEVRHALELGERSLPGAAGPLTFDTRVMDPASLVLMVTGSSDLLTLRDAAVQLEDALIGVNGVARVELLADPGEQISIRVESALADRLGLDAGTLAQVLSARNAVLPSGNLDVGDRSAVLAPRSELTNVGDFQRTPWLLPGGSAVPLGEIADVTREPTRISTARLFHNGQPAVGLSIVPELPQDMVAFGQAVRKRVEQVRPKLAQEGLTIQTFADQPAQVARRLGSLTMALVSSVVIVAIVLLVSMGPRLGLVVSSIVPLVALATVAAYAMLGGVLHQTSVAALVLSLGLVVDNAIVVSETVQRNLDEGMARYEAGIDAVRSLAVPLGTATGTTVAAFVPMLLSFGITADFTRAIPVVVMIALVLSYGFALTATPLLSVAALRKRPAKVSEGWLARAMARLADAVVASPGRSLGWVSVALLAALALTPLVNQQFFPLSDRPIVMVSLSMAEGTHLGTTQGVTQHLERNLADVEGVESITSFVGRGPPRFYYNLRPPSSSPHAATLVIRTDGVVHPSHIMDEVRTLARQLPAATIVPRRLQQGPSVLAPVEIRLMGRSLEDLATARDRVVEALRTLPGLRDIRSDLGLGIPTITWDIDDAAAGRRGVSRSDVTRSLLASTQGITAGVVRDGREPVPVVVGAPYGSQMPAEALSTTSIGTPGKAATPLAAMAQEGLAWSPAAIRRRDRERVVTVLAELDG